MAEITGKSKKQRFKDEYGISLYEFYDNIAQYFLHYVQHDSDNLTKYFDYETSKRVLYNAIHRTVGDNSDSDEFLSPDVFHPERERKFDDSIGAEKLLPALVDGFSDELRVLLYVACTCKKTIISDEEIRNRASVLLDFINHLSKLSGSDRVYTIKDLFVIAKERKYKYDMTQLRDYLEKTGEYYTKFGNGQYNASNFDVLTDFEDQSAFAYAAAKSNLRGRSKNRRLYRTIRWLRNRKKD